MNYMGWVTHSWCEQIIRDAGGLSLKDWAEQAGAKSWGQGHNEEEDTPYTCLTLPPTHTHMHALTHSPEVP